MKNETKTSCPKCGYEIDVNNIISLQVEEKYNSLLAEEKKKFQSEYEKIEIEKKQLNEEKLKQESLIKEQVDFQLKTEKEKLENQIKSKVYEEQSEQIAAYKKELDEKSEQIKELNRSKVEIEKLKREKDELKEAMEVEAERKINQQITVEKEKIRKLEQEKNEFKIKEFEFKNKELEKQLEDQKKLTEEMKRKQEQGSVQLQGEVQELAIEEWLANNFPLDTISEIKKGERGADCIQTIHTRTKQNCGSIYYESKRTKEFKPAWLEKFKDDIREKSANIGVLVTDVFPKGMERMNLIDGIWVCSYEEFKGLCVVLRESIIQLNNLVSSQENKGDKMLMLYDFLTSNEFRLQVEGIVEGFTQMQADLISEKRAIMGHWKKREKQIQKVLLNTNHMYNSIKGIAGNAIQPIKTLELSDTSIDEFDFGE